LYIIIIIRVNKDSSLLKVIIFLKILRNQRETKGMIFLGVRRKTKGIIFHVRKKSRGGVDFSNFPEGYTPPTPQPG
jgi:hypothetical protein